MGKAASKLDVRERPRTSVVVAVCAALLAFVLASFLMWQSAREKRVESARAHAAWQAQNAAALLALSAARGPSAEEQARLTRAGDDPEQLRQALIEIHELRMAYARRDLADAQQRSGETPGADDGYVQSAAGADRVQLLRQDERSAGSQIALYSKALSEIRAWQPMSYAKYMTQRSAGLPVVAASSPAPVAVRRKKVDPRIPMEPARSPGRLVGPSVRSGGMVKPVMVNSGTAAANAPAAIASANPVADKAPRSQADVAEREQNEKAIRGTIQRWASAMLLNDPKAESAEYAPHLERYFLRTDVDRAFVEADKAAYLRRGNLTAGFVVEDMRFENETADAADVRLVKNVAWQQSTNGVTHKTIRSRLHLVRTAAGWKIAGEQDFR